MSSLRFDDFFNQVLASNVADGFRSEILRNRLIRMGFEDIIENRYIQKLGFPCKYNSPLDEAILVTHYFLIMNSLLKGSTIKMYAVHVPTKEEENTLSFWRSAKAGLYLDLHAMVINNNLKYDSNNSISRLFVFRDQAQLAHLEVTGISVILEQQSIGIDTGFVFLSDPHNSSDLPLFRGALLICFEHAERPQWTLLVDKVHGEHPYDNEMACKWFDGEVRNEEIVRCLGASQARRGYLDLFRFWAGDAEHKTDGLCYEFEKDPAGFKDLLTANSKRAFVNLPEGVMLQEDYDKYLPIKRVTERLEELTDTLDRIRKEDESADNLASRSVIAIDATSVKNTLKVHDTDPNYRHWIRNTIQLVIEHPEASLERVYILDLSEAKNEYEVFQQEVDLYYDYLENKISALSDIWKPEEMLNEDERRTVELRENQSIFPANIAIYVTSKVAIETFCRDKRLPIVKKKEILKALGQVFVHNNVPTTLKGITEQLIKDLPKVDLLCADGLIYNYKDYRGEPSQTKFFADRLLAEEVNKKEFEVKRDAYHELHTLLKQLGRPVIKKNSSRTSLPDIKDLEKALENKREEWFADRQKENSQKKSDAGPETLPSVPGAATEPSSTTIFSETSEDEAHAEIIISGLRGSKRKRR